MWGLTATSKRSWAACRRYDILLKPAYSRSRLSTRDIAQNRSSRQILIGANVMGWMAGGLATYFGPFPNTREGIYVGWYYPHELLYKDSFSEFFWKTIVGFCGLTAAFTGVKRLSILTPLSDIARTATSLVCSVATAMLCIDQSDFLVRIATRFSKMVSFFIDGLQLDIGLHDGAPVWERKFGIKAIMIEKHMDYKSAKEKRQSDGKVSRYRETSSIDNMNLEEMEKVLVPAKTLQSFDNASASWKTHQAELRNRHQDFLIEGLLSWRREESLVREQLQMVSSGSSDFKALNIKLRFISDEKQRLKAKCTSFHDASLSKLAESRLQDLVSKLSLLRLQQNSLARQRLFTDSEFLVLTNKLAEIDEEKRILKDHARKTFSLNIGDKGIKLPRWRDVSL